MTLHDAPQAFACQIGAANVQSKGWLKKISRFGVKDPIHVQWRDGVSYAMDAVPAMLAPEHSTSRLFMFKRG